MTLKVQGYKDENYILVCDEEYWKFIDICKGLEEITE